jgi:hypothetical protein
MNISHPSGTDDTRRKLLSGGSLEPIASQRELWKDKMNDTVDSGPLGKKSFPPRIDKSQSSYVTIISKKKGVLELLKFYTRVLKGLSAFN